MDEEESLEEFIKKAEIKDIGQLKGAMNSLIDPVSKFMGLDEAIDNLNVGDFEELLNALNYATYVVSGVMYSYGLTLCMDDHEDAEEEDEE